VGERGHKPTKRGPPAPTTKTDFDEAPTEIYESGDNLKPAPPAQQLVAISMKTPANPNLAPVVKPEREMPHVKLRAMSEVAKSQIPQNLGNLAPPYDPAEARARTVRDYVVWGSLAVIIASGIALVVWLVAG
jgi:hypothetical protein